MAKRSSYLWTSAIGLIAISSAIASCTTGDGDDDGEGGEDAGGQAGEGTGNRSGTGGTGGRGGTSGNGTGGSEAGAAGEPVGGAGGSGGAVDENYCELPGGAGGEGGAAGAAGASGASGFSVDGRSCAQYCDDFFASCDDSDAFENRAECLMLCRFFGNEQLCCRAAAVLVPDCETAAGDGICN